MRPEIVDEYVSDGTLRIEWYDFPYQGQESVNASLAARAAQQQGEFWEYNRLLFENQEPANSGGYSDENLISFAEELDLDTDRFQEDFTSERNRNAVAESFEVGQGLGLSGTPVFVINGQQIVGFQDYEVFSEVIETARDGG